MDIITIAQFVVLGLAFFIALNSAAINVLLERKLAGFLQQRLGPYRTGPWGLLQPVADIVKLLFKEELRPKAADAFLFNLAPILAATAAFERANDPLWQGQGWKARHALRAQLSATDVLADDL